MSDEILHDLQMATRRFRQTHDHEFGGVTSFAPDTGASWPWFLQFVPDSSPAAAKKYPVIGWATTDRGQVIAMVNVRDDGVLSLAPDVLRSLENDLGPGRSHLGWSPR